MLELCLEHGSHGTNALSHYRHHRVIISLVPSIVSSSSPVTTTTSHHRHHHHIVIINTISSALSLPSPSSSLLSSWSSSIYLDPMTNQVQRTLDTERYDPLTGSRACRLPQVLQFKGFEEHWDEIDEDFQEAQCLNELFKMVQEKRKLVGQMCCVGCKNNIPGEGKAWRRWS